MEITPDILREKKFKTSLRGADPKEVREFLKEVALYVEYILAERDELRQKLAELGEKMEECRKMEQVLQETLGKAQENADQVRNEALENARRIKDEANREAQEVLTQARAELAKLEASIRSLHGQKLAIVHEMEGVLESYGKIVERLKKETARDETED